MSKLFVEEQEVLDTLLAEWYEEIKSFTQDADGIFSAKGKMYDRTSPVWERIRFPHGFVQELRKKTDRVDQLLEHYANGGEVEWDEVSEELGDIFNYSRMFGALIAMYLSRRGVSPTPGLDQILDQACNGAARQSKDYLNGAAQARWVSSVKATATRQQGTHRPDSELDTHLGRAARQQEIDHLTRIPSCQSHLEEVVQILQDTENYPPQ